MLEEIELELGLSIGGASFRKSEKPKFNGVDVDPRENEIKTAVLRSTTSSPIALSEPETALLDKREIQALRRQEAKRKREEKKSRGRNGSQTGEQQPSPARKKEKNTDTKNVVLSQGDNSVNVMNVNLNLSNGQTEHPHFPVQTAQYPYPPVQFVPYSTGFAYPCVMQCWAPSGGGGLKPFQANNGCNPEQNGGVTKTPSNYGSPICSSSTVSEHYSTASHEGGASSDTISHSSHLNGSIARETKSQSDHTATSPSIESHSQGNQKLVQPKEEPAPEITEPVPIPKTISSNEASAPTPLKETKMEPPKPQTQNTDKTQMPYVSTTGNGPNGKTIHGFLYRYSKSEISIVCVCHGSTFSPAEFVHHAGGTDVSQPLRHITVIPSAFG